MAPGYALDESSADVRKLVSELHMPPGYTVRLQGQTRNLEETTDNLVMAIALASIFVYMVLAAQFESFIQPVIIMAVLPLSVPFALFTIWATGRTLNLWSALGILLLFGIVKKNSILQVDYTNVLRRRDQLPLREAVVTAGRVRLRPIPMTSIATVLGLVPMSLGIGEGAELQAPLARVVIGGLIASTMITLVFVPTVYTLFEEGWKGMWTKHAE